MNSQVHLSYCNYEVQKAKERKPYRGGTLTKTTVGIKRYSTEEVKKMCEKVLTK